MASSIACGARMLYQALSSHGSGSFLDDGSTHGVSTHNMAVIPSSGVVDSTRVSMKVGRKATPSDNERPPEVVKDDKYPVVSFIIVYTMIFFNGCCFTAVVPSVPFYLQILHAPPSFLGWVVSFYSLGQIFGSPSAGWLTTKLASKRILTISSTLGLFSSTLYAVAPVYMFILISRLLTGISAGMEFTTELTFIAKNTRTHERTTYLASVTAVNVVGFIMGPALGTVVSLLDITILGIRIDQYTGPGWLLVVMFALDLAMVQGLFQDHELVDSSEMEEGFQVDTEQQSLLEKNLNEGYGGLDTTPSDNDCVKNANEPPPSLSMILTLILVQFTVMCAFSVLETITSPLAQDNFGWHVQKCNMLFTAGGFMSLIAYVMFVVASRWVQDRWLIVYALALCFIGFVLAIDWAQLPWMPAAFLSRVLPPYLDRFLAGYLVMNAGFMTGRPVTFALYSKLIASQYQGKYLGWMVAGGSAARTLGPFAAVYVYYSFPSSSGLNLLALFGSVGIFHLICLFLVFAQWNRLLSAGPSPLVQVETKNMQPHDEEYDTHCSSGSSCDSDIIDK